MHRQILIQCLPAALALAGAFLVLVSVVQLSGARLNLKRLRELHACQDGGVQSLAFTLTLPIFIVLMLFIVQITQLMIGLITVNYAAFAAARAASVWIPAEVEGLRANKMPFDSMTSDRPVVLLADRRGSRSRGNLGDVPGGIQAEAAVAPIPTTVDTTGYDSHYKHLQIFTAAVLACAPMAPSRDLGISPALFPHAADSAEVTKRLYASLVPDSYSNRRIPRRIENKIAYSFAHTAVKIEFRDKNSLTGPTYNPDQVAVCDREDNLLYYRSKDRREVGWEDPVTVTVYHNYALLPGPGRLLAKHITGESRRDDPVARRIRQQTAPSGERLYTTQISASATLTNEGLKPVFTYEQQPY